MIGGEKWTFGGIWLELHCIPRVGCGLVFDLSAFLRRFRAILSLVRVRCWFWTFRLTAVSVYLVIGSASVLVSDVPIGGGFVSIMLVLAKKHPY